MPNTATELDDVRILVIEDDPIQVELLRHHLGGDETKNLSFANTGRRGLQLARDLHPQIVLLDLRLPDMEGLTILQALQELDPMLPVVVISATDSVEKAVAAGRQAVEFLPKPLNFERLRGVLEQLKGKLMLRRELAASKGNQKGRHQGSLDDLILRPVAAALRSAALGDAPVLLMGEKGSGRETAARRLHRWSPRASKPFVSVDPKLASSRADGIRRLASALEHAEGGTLFITELRSLDLDSQRFLLAFARGEFRDVLPFDVRLLAAMEEKEGPSGTQELVMPELRGLFGMNIMGLPALRLDPARLMDAIRIILAEESKAAGLDAPTLAPAAEAALHDYRWPGNYGELRGVLRETLLAQRPTVLRAEHLPPSICTSICTSEVRRAASRRPGTAGVQLPSTVKPLWLQEKEFIEAALLEAGGDVLAASRALEIPPTEIYQKQRLWKERGALIENR